jgi:hypothetical protein
MGKMSSIPGTRGPRRLAISVAAALAACVAQAGWTWADTSDAVYRNATRTDTGGDSGTGSPATADPGAEAPKLTAEQVRAAIEEAEQRRLEKARPDPALSGTVGEQLAQRWGVEVIGINLTSAGYMLDFRFRVVNAEKALPLFDHRIKPYVLTGRAHIRLPVPMAPKVGAFRPTNRGKNIKADKTYYMVFANPDSFVKVGEKVSVVIGDFRAENLTVR